MIDNHIFRASSLKEAISMAHESLGSNATIIDMHCIRKEEASQPLYEVHARGIIQKTESREDPPKNQEIRTETPRGETLSTPAGIQEKIQQMFLDVGALRDSTRQWTDTSQACHEIQSQVAANQTQKDERVNLNNNSEITPLRHANKQMPPLQLIHDVNQRDPVVRGVSNALHYMPAIWLKQGPTRAALVGPSGVGKTAALFKIAGIASMRHQLSVSIVNLDTHRPGRIGEHARLSELLGIPHHNLRHATELPNMLEILSHVDLVLIDTPGENPWGLTESSPLLDSLVSAKIELHLVTPATWSCQNLQRLIGVYQSHGVVSAIATRIEESRSLDDLVHSLAYSKLGLSSLSMGDDITGVIQAADPRNIETLLNNTQPGNALNPARFAR